MELEEGMYVRTNGGNIGKIESFVSSLQNDFIKTPYEEYINRKDIKKASYNIIDLIEEGDYVNGLLVIGIERFKDGTWFLLFSEDRYIDNKKCIETIVTKEQFKNMEYKI